MISLVKRCPFWVHRAEGPSPKTLRQPATRHGANSRQSGGKTLPWKTGEHANIEGPLYNRGPFLVGSQWQAHCARKVIGFPMSSKNYLFTSESVTEGHPDKMCDQISDALVDAILAKETRLEKEGYVAPNGRPACLKDVRCAIETFTTTGTIVVMGEVRTQA